MQFILPLKEDPSPNRHTTALHLMLAFLLCAIGASCAVLYWYTWISPTFKETGAYRPFLAFGTLAFLSGITILLLTVFQKQWIRRKRNNLLFRMIELALLGGSCLLFLAKGWRVPAGLFGIMGAVVLFAIFQERSTGSASCITIDESGIKLPATARHSFINWTEIEQVILRFGTLTVECLDNRLLQRSISETPADTASFEHFCHLQIEAGKAKRHKNDW